ncbi:uncharacterized protein Pyn_04233 [Prunus yedoensis var. nudiflora]|uniref:Uncharacterized protein n=1 Tax=Prunus yedoensis var. nudiflora TaxID=2094558 RepID=A0A315A758_PRUYE|nr:uncharacterized protein Pyn_04233 [Prunus yedoensis var. nudiflora]
MENLGFYQTDCESLWSQIKRQEKQIQLKRRWLLGLPTSKSEQKKLERCDFLNNTCLPESFLREDDKRGSCLSLINDMLAGFSFFEELLLAAKPFLLPSITKYFPMTILSSYRIVGLDAPGCQLSEEPFCLDEAARSLKPKE